MNDPKDTPDLDDVKILPPDFTLMKKLDGVNLGKLLSPQAVETAQKVIVDSASVMLEETLLLLEQLTRIEKDLLTQPESAASRLPDIIAKAFSVKSNASQGGYALVAELAKSLQLGCEKIDASKVALTDIKIIVWHIDCMKKVLEMKIKASGGAVGEGILAELDRLAEKMPIWKRS